MTTHKTTALSNDPYQTNEYKECAGKGCKNIGNNKLKIKYVQKFGWFCDTCKKGLKKADLIDMTGALEQ